MTTATSAAGYLGWSMVMSTFANERPTSTSAAKPASAVGGTTAPSAGTDRHLHAQESDHVYQAAGNQYIFDRTLPAPAVAANTLPRDTAVFVGRRPELDSLTATVTGPMASADTIPVVAVDGMPGVGKTTFAVHAAHRLASSFPSGQMFVDMHAHSAGKAPMEPADALFALLSADGASAKKIPEDVDGRSALWRARMAGRRSILIIDNVSSHRQVEPLLPGAAGCLVLVTSRRRLTGLGARHAATTIPLAPLAPEPAAELFIRLTGHAPEPEQEQPVAELVRLCGFLPLAITLLAARLRPEPQWQVQNLVADLVAAQDRLAHMSAEDIQVAAAFELSYRRLPTARRRLFRHLGLSPGGDIDVYAAAALEGVGPATARRHLDALYDDRLVDQPVRGRYRLHDLLGAYARTLAAGDPARQRDLAVGRLLDYYQYAAGLATQQLTSRPHRAGARPAHIPAAVPALAGATEAAAWMDAELPNLIACATYAMGNGDEARLIGLSAALAVFLRRAGPYPQSIALHRAAAEAAGRSGDRSGQAAALYHVGVLLRRAGDYPAAGEVLTEARRLYRELDDPLGEADALTVAGIARRLAGEHGPAAETLGEAMARYRRLADPAGQAEVLTELAAIEYLADDYSAATRLLDQALGLYRQADLRLGQADVLVYLGIVRRLTHDYPAATRAFEEAMSLYRGLGDRVGLAHTQFSVGVVRRLTGDFQDAAGFLDRSLQGYRQVGDQLGQANALKQQGILQRQTGDHSGATENLLAALALYQDLGNRRSQAEVLQELGEARRLAGDLAKATEDLAAAYAIHEKVGSRGGQAEVLNYQGALLLDAADPQARDRFQAALRLAREVGNPLEEARAREGMSRCALHRNDPDEAARQLQAALATYERLGAPEAAAAKATLASLSSRPEPRNSRP